MVSLSYEYIAGFLDGEGSIGIHRDRQRNKYGGFRYKLVVTLTNTNRKVLELIQNKIGGKIYELSSNRKTTQKPRYVLQLRRKEAEETLKKLLPFLIVKKQQALLALEYRKLVKPRKETIRHGPDGKFISTLSKETLKKEEELYKMMLVLNGGWRCGKKKKVMEKMGYI